MVSLIRDINAVTAKHQRSEIADQLGGDGRRRMKVVVTASTYPKSDNDPVPRFVSDQVAALAEFPNLDLHVLIPHNAYGDPVSDVRHLDTRTEIRFNYFWPRRAQTLTGRGIMPAIKRSPWKVLLIPFFLFCQRRALDKLCQEVQPDLIYAHWFFPQAVVAQPISRKRKIPLMFTTHASDVSVLNILPFASKLVRSVVRSSFAYTAVSHRTAKKLMTMFSSEEWDADHAEKMSIIPMGTHLPNNSSRRHLESSSLEGLRVNPEKKMILALGRHVEKKGLTYLIDGYGRLPDAIKDQYQLVIAGEGRLTSRLKAQAQRVCADHPVVFPGYVTGQDKYALFEAADLFVLPSIIDSTGDSEGFPVALIEALGYGKLVIATNVSGAEDSLGSDVGLLIEPQSPVAIADAISEIVGYSPTERDRKQRLSQDFASQFDWKFIAQSHYDIIQKAPI